MLLHKYCNNKSGSGPNGGKQYEFFSTYFLSRQNHTQECSRPGKIPQQKLFALSHPQYYLGPCSFVGQPSHCQRLLTVHSRQFSRRIVHFVLSPMAPTIFCAASSR